MQNALELAAPMRTNSLHPQPTPCAEPPATNKLHAACSINIVDSNFRYHVDVTHHLSNTSFPSLAYEAMSLWAKCGR